MKISDIVKHFTLFGVLAGVCYFLHVFLGTILYPGYNSFTQAISDLTALSSPSKAIANLFSSLYGIFSCIGTFAIYIQGKNIKRKYFSTGLLLFSLMNWISFIGYFLFPLKEEGCSS